MKQFIIEIVTLSSWKENLMISKAKLGVACLFLAIAAPAVAQPYFYHDHTWCGFNGEYCQYHHRYHSGFWPGNVAAGIVGGAIGTAGAIASAPFHAFDSNASMYGSSYCAQRYRSYDPVSETYMGHDHRRHPCP